MNYLLLLLLLYILWRLVSGFSNAERGPRHNGGEAPDSSHFEELVQDPVCGTYVSKSTALTAKKRDELFYFCGKECRKKFLENRAGD